ncbi:MAG: hypothetical protein ABIH67_01410 [Candidatus Uhrbacteria bacterium]
MDHKPHQYSGSARLAASINVTCHGGRQCDVTREPFATFPSILALNLAEAKAWKPTICAAFLYGACDQGSTYSYQRMEIEFDDQVVSFHQQSNWTWIMEQSNLDPGNGSWEDAFIRLRGHLRNAPPQAILLWLAREHYEITALQNHAQRLTEGLEVWKRLFQGFPSPYNRFATPENPYQQIHDYYQGLLQVLRQPVGRRSMYQQVFQAFLEMQQDFRRACLI